MGAGQEFGVRGVCKSMRTKLIYLAGPVTNTSWEEAVAWRKQVHSTLLDMGMDVLNPVRHGANAGDKFITYICRQDVENCNVLFVNLLGAEKISIGTVIEIAWADMMRKPIVLVIDDDYEWDYGIFREITPFRAKTLEDGIDYIRTLV